MEEGSKLDSAEIAEQLGQQFVQEFKEKGQVAEVIAILNTWTDEQEKLVYESHDPATAAIELNLRRARLYHEAGLIEETRENYNDARKQAHNEGRTELFQAIEEEMDSHNL